MGIGERLREERERLGLAQKEFGTKCGVSKTSQFNYEVGERSPDGEYFSLADSLGVDTAYVITGRRSKAAANDDFVVIPGMTLRPALALARSTVKALKYMGFAFARAG